MLAEEIISLNNKLRQAIIAAISEGLTTSEPPELDSMSLELTARSTGAALEIGYLLASHMEELRNYSLMQFGRAPNAVYKSESIWPERRGNFRRKKYKGIDDANNIIPFNIINNLQEVNHG